MSIRVLLADDHRIVREGLHAVMGREDDVEIVGEAANGREVLEQTRRLVPDVVLMDVAMPELNGLEATRRLKRIDPRVRVVALSTHTDNHYVLGMFEAGAAGYVLKDSAVEEVLTAIRGVQRGDKYLSPALTGILVDSYVDRRFLDSTRSRVTTTPREREVLQLLAEGRTSGEIARRLHLAPATIDTHRRNLMKKLNLHSIAALTKYAVREGLTGP